MPQDKAEEVAEDQPSECHRHQFKDECKGTEVKVEVYRSKCVSGQSFWLQGEEQTAPHEARVADGRPIRK